MKKNILYFCLVILLVLPICVNADTFEESSNKVSSYLDRNEYKNSYNKYLYITESNRFSGMIGKKEFAITRYDKDMNYRSMNYSYLWNGKSYWSETVESGKNIPIRNDLLSSVQCSIDCKTDLDAPVFENDIIGSISVYNQDAKIVEIGTVIRILPTSKIPGQDDVTGKFY